jgi:hypothetical protein
MSLILKASLFIVIAACIAAIVLKRSRGAIADPELTGSVTSAIGEVQALDALRKAGNDVTKPTEVTYYLVFPNDASARRAADSVRAFNFEGEVLSSRSGDWTCIASARMVPEQAAILETTKKFKALAASLGGRFDRWEAEVAQ